MSDREFEQTLSAFDVILAAYVAEQRRQKRAKLRVVK